MQPNRHLAFVALVSSVLSAPQSRAGDATSLRVAVERFVTLPDGVRHPEGLASNPRNDELLVGTFDVRLPECARNNQLLRCSAQGRLVAQKSFGPTPLAGLAVADGMVYVLNFGASRLQGLDAEFSAVSHVEDVVSIPALEPPMPQRRGVVNPDAARTASSSAPAASRRRTAWFSTTRATLTSRTRSRGRSTASSARPPARHAP